MKEKDIRKDFIEIIELKHKRKMEELDFERKTEMIKHQNALEMSRIKMANISRTVEMKERKLRY